MTKFQFSLVIDALACNKHNESQRNSQTTAIPQTESSSVLKPNPTQGKIETHTKKTEKKKN